MSGTESWLSIVGIGEDGADGLSAQAREAVTRAAHVFGARRHLDLATSLVAGEAHPWPQPFDASMSAVVARRGERVAVLASGDPFCHGVGATLARVVARNEMRVFPAPSAFSLAAARLGWTLQEAATISCHGLPVERLRPLLRPGARVIALTSDAAGPAAVAGLLARHGFGPTRLIVLEALGGPRERIRETTAATFALDGIDALNVVALEVRAGPGARVIPATPGLPDDWFEHDGQITKREVRAVTLSALAPLPGALLWDIGAGSGSVAIEWMLASGEAVAIEADPARARRMRENAMSLGVPSLRVVEGEAPAALAGLPPPDAVFVGGGGTDPGVIEAALGALRPGGRLVANAVTLEMERLLLALHAGRGGALTRLSVERAGPIGGMSGWRPALPVTQWCWTKADAR